MQPTRKNSSKSKQSAVKDACLNELHRLDQSVRDISDKLSATADDDMALVDIHIALYKANRELKSLLK